MIWKIYANDFLLSASTTIKSYNDIFVYWNPIRMIMVSSHCTIGSFQSNIHILGLIEPFVKLNWNPYGKSRWQVTLMLIMILLKLVDLILIPIQYGGWTKLGFWSYSHIYITYIYVHEIVWRNKETLVKFDYELKESPSLSVHPSICLESTQFIFLCQVSLRSV